MPSLCFVCDATKFCCFFFSLSHKTFRLNVIAGHTYIEYFGRSIFFGFVLFCFLFASNVLHMYWYKTKMTASCQMGAIKVKTIQSVWLSSVSVTWERIFWTFRRRTHSDTLIVVEMLVRYWLEKFLTPLHTIWNDKTNADHFPQLYRYIFYLVIL